jgi:hypothetical protein
MSEPWGSKGWVVVELPGNELSGCRIQRSDHASHCGHAEERLVGAGPVRWLR